MPNNKPKKQWLAGYPSFLDWYLLPDTPENRKFVDDANWDGDTYPSYKEAKKALVDIVKERISDDRAALKGIRKRKKAECKL